MPYFKIVEPRRMKVSIENGLSFGSRSIDFGRTTQWVEGTPEQILAWATKALAAALVEIAKA